MMLIVFFLGIFAGLVAPDPFPAKAKALCTAAIAKVKGLLDK